jgi:hypothetical protein
MAINGRLKNGCFKKGHTINVGRTLSAEHIQKIAQANRDREHRKGWHHSTRTRKKISIAKMGEKNPQWTANPSYGAVHVWINRNYKKSKTCDFCGSKRFLEWALKKGKKHEHSVENYWTLCSSCHKKYDYTPQHREKMRRIMTGRVHTWGAKISKSLKGRKLSDEHKRKMRVYAKRHPKPRNEMGRFYSTKI